MSRSSDKHGHFGSIDGFRGLAALAVVLYHLSANLKGELNSLFPEFVNVAMSYGYLGVPVFFVISGFVISMAIGSAAISRGYFGNFVLRRSIRLDLTYWMSIVTALLLLQVKSAFLAAEVDFPSLQTILVHMFYLQDIAGVNPIISSVYWTLCLEVQLYLFFILSLWAVQRWVSLNNLAHVVLCMGLGLYSIMLDLNLIENIWPGLFVSSWHYFLMGYLASNVVRGKEYSKPIFIGWLLLESYFQISILLNANVIAGVFCSALIYLLWAFKYENSFVAGGVFRYFGMISYTLYLVHADIGWKVISVCKSLLGGDVSPELAGLILLLGILVSIVVAHIFHLLFERPTLILSKKLKSMSLRCALAECRDEFKLFALRKARVSD